MAEFAKIFKQLRLERELSQSRLADQLGISKSAVNMYERGDRRPDFETAEAIADFFNVDMEKGLLVMNGKEMKVDRPNCIIFHKLEPEVAEKKEVKESKEVKENKESK